MTKLSDRLEALADKATSKLPTACATHEQNPSVSAVPVGIANAEIVIPTHDAPTPSFEEVLQNLASELSGRYHSAQAEVERLKGFLVLLFVNAEKAPEEITPDVVKFFADAALKGFSQGPAFEKWSAQAIETRRAKTQSGSVHESAVHAPKPNQEPTNG